MPFDDALVPPEQSPLARPFELDGIRVGNRFCVLPMEGWDGTPDGEPTELTRRRWRNFGESGAKLIWGGEAVAVRHDGRANPNQLLLTPSNASRDGRRCARSWSPRIANGSAPNADGDLFVGLQLTHSGRFRPNAHDQRRAARRVRASAPRSAVPVRRAGAVDDELDRLVEDFVAAARLAATPAFSSSTSSTATATSGTSCSARARGQGRTADRSRTARGSCATIIDADPRRVPGLLIGVRLSAFDLVPFRKARDGVGEPDPTRPTARSRLRR